MSKKKANKDNSYIKENSMVFNKPEKPQVKPKSRLKIGMSVFIGIVVLIIAVPLLIIMVTGKHNEDIINTGKPRQSYEELLSITIPTEHSEKLYGMKNPELSDTAAVEEIIGYINTEERLGGYTVSVKNAEKPYSITLKFNNTHEIGAVGEDEWELGVIQQSCMIMALIDNIAEVKWEFPTENSSTSGALFTRNDAGDLMKLGIPIERFAESATAVQLLMNHLGIDIY